MFRSIVIITTLALLLTTSFAFGQETAQIMVVTGRIHQEYQWILNEDDAEVMVSLYGREGEKYPAILYPESALYVKMFLALSGHVAQVGDNVTVFVNHGGVNLWTDSHRLGTNDIGSGTCVIDIKPTGEGNEQSPIMVIAGHVDETFREIFNDPETGIVISLGDDMHISGKIVDDGQTYTGVFITLDGYVAKIDDIVTVSIYRNGVTLWERSSPVTQQDLERAVVVINLEQVITADIKRRSALVTWGSLKEKE